MNTSIGIEAIGTYLPPKSVDNLARGAAFEFSEEFLRGKIGFLEMREAEGDQRCFDMARGAILDLVACHGLDLTQVDCLIVCTQNPDGHGLPNTASALHGELGLSQDCAAFDISLGCSGYVYGLSIISSFMQANGLSCGLLVTSDPYSTVVQPDDRDCAALFGDAATATLMVPGGRWQIGRSRFGSDGTRRNAIAVSDSGALSMNGRGVFVFAAQTVPPLLERVAAENGVTLEDVDLILAHQGSRYIVDEIARRLGVAQEKLPFLAQDTANTVSSSIPLMLADRLDGPARRILLTGFGVGLSWGATLISHINTGE